MESHEDIIEYHLYELYELERWEIMIRLTIYGDNPWWNEFINENLHILLDPNYD